MQITEANIGDIIMMNGTGKRFQIEDIQGKFVIYLSEGGNRYSSEDKTINATKITDRSAIEQFEQNAAAGRVMTAAQNSAISKILSGTLEPQDREEAAIVLHAANKQKNHLESQLSAPKTVQKAPSLNDILSKAEQKRTESFRTSKQPNIDLER